MTESKTSPSLKQILLWNVAIIVGIAIGFLNVERHPAPNVMGRIAVFSLAFFNLLLLGRHRLGSRQEGLGFWIGVWTVLADRRLISMLVALQLWSTGQAIGAVITLVSAYHSPQVIGQQLQGRLILVSMVMSVVAMLWLTGALGLWLQRKWGWWLAVILNGLSACTGIVVQVAALTVLRRNEFLIDSGALATFVMLLLTRTRLMFWIDATPPLDPVSA